MNKRLLFVALVAMIAATLLGGCGNDLNEDYHGEEGGYHEFADPAVQNHAAYVEESGYDFGQCTDCHGAELAGVPTGPGGSTIRSCYRCHAGSQNHPGDFTNVAAEHSTALREANWEYDNCLICHAELTLPEDEVAFGGSCSSSNCHSAEAGGPQACNVCHGSFAADPSDPASWAPPFGLGDEIDPADPAIGAHQVHMAVDTLIYAQFTCNNCHRVPLNMDSRNHIEDDTPNRAEVIFGAIAGSDGGGQYDRTDNSCSVYCHQTAEPVWTNVGADLTCGECHSMPPPAPHPAESNCVQCHSPVVDAENNIIDPSLHINGTTDLDIP